MAAAGPCGAACAAGHDRSRRGDGSAGEGRQSGPCVLHRIRLRALCGLRAIGAHRCALRHTAEARDRRPARHDERPRDRGRDAKRGAPLPGDAGGVGRSGGAGIPARGRARGGGPAVVPARARQETRSVPGRRRRAPPRSSREPDRRDHCAAPGIASRRPHHPDAAQPERGARGARASGFGSRAQARQRAGFLFALGGGVDGVRHRLGRGGARTACSGRHPVRLVVPAAGRQRSDGRRNVVSRILILAGLLSGAAVAQPQPLALDAAVNLALQRNSDLQRQILLSLSAEQDRVIARSAVLPQLTFNASAAEQRTNGLQVVQGVLVPGTFQTERHTTYEPLYSSRLQLSQLVFDGGKWWNNLAAADLGEQASREQVDEQRLQITYLVEQRFYELVRAQRQLAVLAEAATRSRDQANYTQRLFEGGRATQADVYAARANRDNDEVQRLGQERVVELARSDLSTAIGLDPGSPLTVAEPQNMMSTPVQPPPVPDAICSGVAPRPRRSRSSRRRAATAWHRRA
ncbi:MAG: TolC family protein [Deltaproteobacteria bacterium]|nr:MAG: TolC family protein [Deltaproteobacteria bacterium]